MPTTTSVELKSRVHEFWNERSCGETYATGPSERERFETQSRTRYELEPYLLPFARFSDAAGKDALEIGVGMGADHVELAQARPNSLSGIDLTARAVDHTRQRLRIYGLNSDLRVSDAEQLPFADTEGGQFGENLIKAHDRKLSPCQPARQPQFWAQLSFLHDGWVKPSPSGAPS